MRTNAFDDTAAAPTQAPVVTISGSNGPEQAILAQDLMTELMGVVSILGQKKVSVGFAGSGAFCDAKLDYVNIPALPATKTVPIQIAREIRGFAAHEAAHIAFTDNTIFPAQIVDDQGNFDPLLKEVWNCVEDYMIENLWLMLYPGAKKNFAATEIRCCRGYQELYSKDPDVAKDLRRVGPVSLTWLRALEFGLGTSVSRECFQTLSPEHQRRAMDWFDLMRDVETTQDCLDVARQIHADILADPYDPNDPPANLSPNQNQGQGQGQGQGQSQGQGQGQGKGSGPGAASGAPSQNPGQGQGPAPVPTSHNLDDVLQDAGLVDDDCNFITAEVVSSMGSGPQSDLLGDQQGFQAANDAAAGLQSSIASTSAQLRKALKAIAKDRYKSGRRDGKLDRARVARLRTGSTDIFRRKIEGEKIDTALEILVDCSGSMGGHELALCQQLAVMLETALRGTPVEQEIVGYTTADVDDADPVFQTMIQAHQAQGTDVYVRATGSYEFRKFGASHVQAMTTIGNMTNVDLGGTPTSEGILLAHDRLARRPERRHVMFVLTDGEPDDNRACRNAVRAVEKCGVTVIGIGICTDAVKKAFDNYVVINQADDLPAVMMNRLSSILIGDKRLKAKKGAGASAAA